MRPPMTLFYWLWPIPIDVLNLFVNSVDDPVPEYVSRQFARN